MHVSIMKYEKTRRNIAFFKKWLIKKDRKKSSHIRINCECSQRHTNIFCTNIIRINHVIWSRLVPLSITLYMIVLFRTIWNGSCWSCVYCLWIMTTCRCLYTTHKSSYITRHYSRLFYSVSDKKYICYISTLWL